MKYNETMQMKNSIEEYEPENEGELLIENICYSKKMILQLKYFNDSEFRIYPDKSLKMIMNNKQSRAILYSLKSLTKLSLKEVNFKDGKMNDLNECINFIHYYDRISLSKQDECALKTLHFNKCYFEDTKAIEAYLKSNKSYLSRLVFNNCEFKNQTKTRCNNKDNKVIYYNYDSISSCLEDNNHLIEFSIINTNRPLKLVNFLFLQYNTNLQVLNLNNNLLDNDQLEVLVKCLSYKSSINKLFVKNYNDVGNCTGVILLLLNNTVTKRLKELEFSIVIKTKQELIQFIDILSLYLCKCKLDYLYFTINIKYKNLVISNYLAKKLIMKLEFGNNRKFEYINFLIKLIFKEKSNI